MSFYFKIVACQVGILLTLLLLYVLVWQADLESIKAALFGGMTSVLSTLVLALRMHQATRQAEQGNVSKKYIYLGALERFLMTVVLMGLGLVALKLEALPLILGLVAGHFGFVVAGIKIKG